MANKIAAIRYPKTIQDLVMDPDLLEVFYPYATKAPQVWNMVSFVDEKPSPKSIYSVYLAPDASLPVPVNGRLSAEVKALRAREEAGEAADWAPLTKALEKDFVKILNSQVLPAFYKSKRFEAFHRDNVLSAARDAMDSPQTVARKLKVRNVKQLESLMIAVTLNEMEKAGPLADKLIRAEKLSIDKKTLLTALKSGKVPAANAKPKTMNVTPESLSRCGFSKPKDKTLQKAVKELVKAVHENDRVLFLSLAKNLCGLEPRDSPIAKMSPQILLKTLFKAKVLSK
ncbi:hypothetical protein [Roseibium litorale]|uniref:Uncharacterized protein n=1 Tax=Roseibium litorale TaxID=2803841 RepID=A0ABR9CK96_9HYPH|nr:hypothetical protein [Roseibium litorale]MBD8891277.1 hypothetical protein [Roseibium litorale]